MAHERFGDIAQPAIWSLVPDARPLKSQE